ncbi:TetR/AcrR family transcriptional regulator [Streptomyces aureus]
MSQPYPPSAERPESFDEPVLMQLSAPEATPLRADAARNRARLLEAAARLVEEQGVARLTMEGVACAAAVGKGTVFRRFGDRNGLLMALLDHTEQSFQRAFISGPAPLGPGAPAVERLHAFGGQALRLTAERLDMYLAAEPESTRRFTTAPYRVRFMHVCMLLRQTGPGPDTDTELLAQTLMGYLDPALIGHLTRQRGMSPERLEAGWCDLVDRSVGPRPV